MSDSTPILKTSPLERKIEELIARDLGIAPNEVTAEFIQRWREEHLYTNAQHGLNAKYGGYNSRSGRILSVTEIEAVKERAERFMQLFSTLSEGEELDVENRPPV